MAWDQCELLGTLAKVVDVWDGLSDDGMAGFVACTGAVGGWLFDGGGGVNHKFITLLLFLPSFCQGVSLQTTDTPFS